MKTSKQGIELIKRHEGLRLVPYLCPAGVPTVGYGHTGSDVRMGAAITESEAERLLISDLLAAEAAVNRELPDINQSRFDALVSFVYNVGAGAFGGSTLLKKIRQNSDDPTIGNEFMKWVNAGGKPLAGLVARRKEEANLYFSYEL